MSASRIVWQSGFTVKFKEKKYLFLYLFSFYFQCKITQWLRDGCCMYRLRGFSTILSRKPFVRWMRETSRTIFREGICCQWRRRGPFVTLRFCPAVTNHEVSEDEEQNKSCEKKAYILPCIRLAREKFELTNQDSAGGKKSSVLTSSKQVRKGFEIRQLFLLNMALNIHEKGFTI